MKACQSCSWWMFGPVGQDNLGQCWRYPKVEFTKQDRLCGEWTEKPAEIVAAPQKKAAPKKAPAKKAKRVAK